MPEIYAYSESEIQHATDQALETLLWVSTDAEGNPLDHDHSVDEFPEEQRATMKLLVGNFMEAYLEPLVKSGHVAGWGNDMGKIAQIGHDYVLTTGGHGAGFWDRGLGDLGDTLTEACHADRHEWHVDVQEDGTLWCEDLTGYKEVQA